jgi:type I restriction enzyme R subunit
MPERFSESTVEDAALAWLAELGWAVKHGPEIAPGELFAERKDYGETVLLERFRSALVRLNPSLPEDTLADAERRVLGPDAPLVVVNNQQFHRWLVDGITSEFRASDGEIRGHPVRLVDFDDLDNNDWLAVNQFTVTESGHNRRPDIVLFVNGLPLAGIELKSPADENTDIWSAYRQYQTYKAEIPSLYTYNDALVISDALEARMGTLTAGKEWFLPWRTIEGQEVEPASRPQLEVLLRGAFDRRRFIDLVRWFVVFDDDGSGKLTKKMAGYHQFHAVQAAVDATVKASRPKGDRKAGVVWHTQGSGKSLTMAFFAGRIVEHPAMENPTIVVITDRNDLDDQLFDTFCGCAELLRQKPVQAESRDHLRKLLDVASGGVVFTTIQKFMPTESAPSPQPSPKGRGSKLEAAPTANAKCPSSSTPLPMGEGRRGEGPLSQRRNIVVIADEAHRSQYNFIKGFARDMRDTLPNASFIGFTATPVDFSDRNTRAVFGNDISVYDIQRAVDDNATVRIYYEGRLAKIDLPEAEKRTVDTEFEEVTEEEEVAHKEKLKSRWARLEKVVGAKKRIAEVAKDLVEHWEQRLEAMDGKAMVVCMSRRICVDLHDEIVKLRPGWGGDEETGRVKVVMTGSATDPAEWQPHIRNKEKRRKLADRFKDSKDPFQIVIVRDMWLTGFDAPCLHTMYLDKPMRGHGLMQAIARVNRVFRDKPGGLVVDYIGIADSLKKALAAYTESGGKGKPTFSQEEAVAKMLEKYEVCCDLFAGFDWSDWTGKPAQRIALLPKAQEHILAQEDGQERYVQVVKELSVAFALSVPHEETKRIRDDVGFFQAVRAALGRKTSGRKLTEDEMDLAIKQIVSRAISADKPIDIFAEAGLKKPDISILSDEFLAEVRGMPQRNLAVELLRKLLNDEIKTRSRTFLVQSRSFAEMLERAITEYHNRTIETLQIIERLIKLAEEMRKSVERGEKLKLSAEELAFYDALETNDSAVAILGDETLRTIAREVADKIRNNVSIDWTMKESVRARLRVLVKRVLRNHGYPPDKQEQATKTVLEQAELIAPRWAA